MLRNKKGQSTLEYIILVSGVVVVLVAFLVGTGGNSPFQTALNATLDTATDGMEDMADRLANSRLRQSELP